MVDLIQGKESLQRVSEILTKPDNIEKLFEIDNSLIEKISGKKVAIIGKTGSGKSTFLYQLASSFNRTQNIEYVAQDPWVFSGSLEENVCFEEVFCENKLAKALYATDLDTDLILMGKDTTLKINSSGSNLSGGQRLRLAMARSIYGEATTIFLDEPLGPLDSKVREKIVKRCFDDVWKNCTVVLVTSNISDIHQLDFVIKLEDDYTYSVASVNSSIDATDTPNPKKANINNLEFALEKSPNITQKNKYHFIEGFKNYLKLLGSWRLAIIIISLFTFREILILGADINISRILSNPSLTVSEMRNFVLEQFTIVALSVLMSASMIYLLLERSLKASNKLHRHFINYFITNKDYLNEDKHKSNHLSRNLYDQKIMDNTIGQKFIDFSTAAFSLLGAVILICSQAPFAIFLFVPLIYIYWKIQRIYRVDAVNLASLESTTAGEVMQMIDDYVEGIPCLNFSNKKDYFVDTYLIPYLRKLEYSLYLSQKFERWFSLRMELIGASIFSIIAIFYYLSMQNGPVLPYQAGLALAYSAIMTATLGRVIRCMTDLERNLVSSENLLQYSTLNEAKPLEEASDIKTYKKLKVSNLNYRYFDSEKPALKNLSFALKSGERLVVTGRTGSGKSTIVNAIMGARSDMSGEVAIDDIYLSKMDTEQIVNYACLVPQQPELLPGTIREILCHPTKKDSDIWGTLKFLSLDQVINKLPGGLDSDEIDNLSKGQKQRLMMANAILSNASLVILDEPTANVDSDGGRALMGVILNALSDKMVIVITHQIDLIDLFGKSLELKAGVGDFRLLDKCYP